MSDSVDYYKILGVPKDASQSQIKARYQLLAKKFHPDHDGDDNMMSLINEAYQVLSNPEKKRQYDQKDETHKANNSTDYSYSNQNRQNTNKTYSTHQSDNFYQSRPNTNQSKAYTQTKTQQQLKKEQDTLRRLKSQNWAVKYPYVLPAIFGLFTIAAAWSSPYVNRTKWIVWTSILVGLFSYFYQKLVLYSIKIGKKRTSVSFTVSEKDKRAGLTGTVIASIVILAFTVLSVNSAPAKGNTSANTANTACNAASTSVFSGVSAPTDPQALQLANAVVSSKEHYYCPTNAASYSTTYEQYFANNCFAGEANQLPAFSQYTQAQQTRFCGCTLAILEQNYDFSQALQLQQAVNSGTPATALDNQDIQTCSGL
jgi:DnaJ domain